MGVVDAEVGLLVDSATGTAATSVAGILASGRTGVAAGTAADFETSGEESSAEIGAAAD